MYVLLGRILKRVVRAAPPELEESAKRVLPQGIARRIHRALKAVDTRQPDDDLINPLRRNVHRLHDKLWGGYAGYAVDDLEALRLAPTTPPSVARKAAACLARYYAATGEHQAAIERVAFIRAGSPREAGARRNKTVEVNEWLALGQIEHAGFVLDHAPNRAGEFARDTDAQTAAVHRSRARLGLEHPAIAHNALFEALNRPLLAAGFGAIGVEDPGQIPTLSRVEAVSLPPWVAPDAVKVSVLMAAYNIGEGIEPAIRSVLAQTWRNLELIVVDDASSDDTADVVGRLAAEDARLHLIRRPTNGGAYAARNTALNHATGHYVVVNDADDWAHPQKIEAQARDMNAHAGSGANLTYRLRVNADFMPVVRLDSPHVPIIHNDFSALMIARDRAVAMGGWDPVRFSADTEFIERFRLQFDDDPVRKIHPGVPLSLSFFDDTNLTGGPATGIYTNRFGARCEYERAFREWHAAARPVVIERHSQTDPFPVPTLGYQPPRGAVCCDVLLVSDFRLPGGTTECNRQYLAALHGAGLRVGCLHWGRYDIDPRHSGWPRISAACREFGAVPVVHGETVDCDLVLVHHPPIMMWQPDRVPTIHCRRVGIVVNQLPQRRPGGANLLYEPTEVQARVQNNFGRRGLWIPVSPLVRRHLAPAVADDELGSEDWLPALDLTCWQRPPCWRGSSRSHPCVGRHASDHWFKWPATADDIRAAYARVPERRVRFLGGAEQAIAKLGYQPKNWDIVPFGGEDTLDFLASLDIFVHLLHDNLEAFGRNIMEAMAAGLPVICSPVFRESFGDAAIYAQPEEVDDAVDALWQDRARYLEMARRGQAFVAEHCDVSVIAPRVQRLLADRPLESEASASQP